MIGILLTLSAFIATTANAASCDITTACSREHAPALCSGKGSIATGTNKCEASKMLQRTLCEKGINIQNADISCKSHVTVKIKEVSCDQKRACTHEYRPATCYYNGKRVRGSNLCSTSARLETIACKNGNEGKAITVECAQEFLKPLILK